MMAGEGEASTAASAPAPARVMTSSDAAAPAKDKSIVGLGTLQKCVFFVNKLSTDQRELI